MCYKALLFVSVMTRLKFSRSMEPFIVGGKPASMEYFGHSAFLNVETNGYYFVCGASIINQHVILSAAHCFEDFEGRSKIIVRAGSANKLKGSVRYASRLAVHTGYDPQTIHNDIALAYLKKPLVLGPNIKRVIIMKRPPSSTLGYVAGWGLVDERSQADSIWLQQAEQKLWSRDECSKILRKIPQGSICGGAKYSKHYAAEGDSGSALVINGGIQVGLVSFKRPEMSQALVVYTDVPYFYDWITTTAHRLHCS